MARREWVHVNEVQRILDETESAPVSHVRYMLRELIREQVAGTDTGLCPTHGIDRGNCCGEEGED